MTTSTNYFVADLVEEVGSLPALAAQIVAMTSDPECDLGALTRAILSDNVMSMRFLAVVNSAAISGGGEVRDLRRALIKLGLRRVRNVALCMGMHDMLPSGGGSRALAMEDVWKFSLATASCAEGLAWLRGEATQEDAWLAGILHGIGIPAMDQKLGADFQRAVARAAADGTTLAAAELTVLDFHHGELGGRILGEWKLPRVFVEAVEFCPEPYEPGEVSEEAEQLIGDLRGAIAIVRAIGLGHNGDGTPAPRLAELVEQLEIEDALLTALASKVDRDVGWMSRIIGLDIPDNFFTDVLEESKRQVARVGLEGLDESLVREDLEQQLDLARDIQQRMLPETTPELDGCAIAAINRPSLHVSGDWYDFLRRSDGGTAVVLADVSGKGMSASLLASNLQATLRALSGVLDDPGALLAAANDALYESTTPDRFATLFFGVLGPDGRSLRFANAGHNPPLLLRADGTADWLQAAGTPLGMVPSMAYPVRELDLAPGDVLVAYTDGIVEAMDPSGEEYEEDGLEAAVRAAAAELPDGIIGHLLADVARHAAGQTPESAAARLIPASAGVSAPETFGDDLTVIVVRVV
jgi:HD-like signal output (HDOD) protein